MYKVHRASDSGFWPCGITDPHLTSENPDEVTCHFCKANLKWSEENRDRIDAANAWFDESSQRD